jgi:hypothetical protein
VTSDAIVRTVAVCAAVAILAAPYWRVVAAALEAGAEAAQAHAVTLGRFAAAGLIVAAAWGQIPLPSLPGVIDVPAVVVPEPSPAMQSLAKPVAKALAGLPADKRALWAATWAKAALVVEAESGTTVAVFSDTPALRLFTTIALDVAWRRLGDMPPGSVDGLRTAVETAMRSALGLDAVPVTPQMRASYAEVARAIAWAGTR